MFFYFMSSPTLIEYSALTVFCFCSFPPGITLFRCFLFLFFYFIIYLSHCQALDQSEQFAQVPPTFLQLPTPPSPTQRVFCPSMNEVSVVREGWLHKRGKGAPCVHRPSSESTLKWLSMSKSIFWVLNTPCLGFKVSVKFVVSSLMETSCAQLNSVTYWGFTQYW